MMDWTKVLLAVAIMAVIGGLLGLMLAVADKKLAVKIDERVENVTKLLPGVNCGACGYPGCAGLATALVGGEVNKVSACRVAKQDAKEKIKEYMNSTPGPDGKITKVDL
ncbi:MAG TPA: (Fe-S)-binding protein [Bacilli bacterium]|nr:(Fe-S)-binding protein [Bacilli bacterium]